MQRCTEVSQLCPVEATTYGYYPSLAGSSVFIAVFGALAIAQVILSIRYRIYWYSAVLAVGCVGEAIGYGGRILMNDNPWSEDGFKTQIVCLILSPSFIAAGIYLTLKHLTQHFGPEYSRLKPSLYTWIFIGCDIASILLQAAGGSVAAAAEGGNTSMLDVGNNIMIAGIAFQVGTMSVCGLLAADFCGRVFMKRGERRQALSNQTPNGSWKASVFCGAVAFAYLTLLIRCIYRLPEMAGGWGNPRMRNEKEFLILDGLMVLLSSLALTVAHPGYMLPIMGSSKSTPPKTDEEISMS